MSDACNIRHRDEPLFDLDSLDLRKCHSFEVNSALNEFELKHPGLSHRFETWPAEVQLRFGKVIDEWKAKNQGRAIRLVSSGLHRGVAVVILHYAET